MLPWHKEKRRKRFLVKINFPTLFTKSFNGFILISPSASKNLSPFMINHRTISTLYMEGNGEWRKIPPDVSFSIFEWKMLQLFPFRCHRFNRNWMERNVLFVQLLSSIGINLIIESTQLPLLKVVFFFKTISLKHSHTELVHQAFPRDIATRRSPRKS